MEHLKNKIEIYKQSHLPLYSLIKSSPIKEKIAKTIFKKYLYNSTFDYTLSSVSSNDFPKILKEISYNMPKPLNLNLNLFESEDMNTN